MPPNKEKKPCAGEIPTLIDILGDIAIAVSTCDSNRVLHGAGQLGTTLG